MSNYEEVYICKICNKLEYKQFYDFDNSNTSAILNKLEYKHSINSNTSAILNKLEYKHSINSNTSAILNKYVLCDKCYNITLKRILSRKKIKSFKTKVDILNNIMN